MPSKNANLRARYFALKHGRDWRAWPVVRNIRAMQFRRMQPLGKGKSLGLSIARYYWADFLEQHSADIRGRALEVEETVILHEYGGSAVSQADAIDLSAHHDDVRVVADLSRADHVPGDTYDCFVLSFSANVILDIEAALYHAIRMLKPGGVLLANFWCVDYYLHRGLDMGTGGTLYLHHYFTPIQVRQLFFQIGLDEQHCALNVYGNLMARIAFLLNLPAKDLTARERDTADAGQPLMICVRAVKPREWRAQKPAYMDLLWTPQIAPSVMRADTRQYGDEYK